MEERKLNEQESLALIASMIRNTQNRLERTAGMPFLIWGYTTLILSVIIALLLRYTGDYEWQFLWFVLPAVGYPLTVKFTGKKTKLMVTYIDKVLSYIWMVIGIAAFVISAGSIIVGYCSSFRLNIPIFFCIIILMGIGTAITGLITKFKPCVWSGFFSMGIAFLPFFVSGTDSYFVFAMVFIVMMIIPGHILNAKAKRVISA